MIVTRTCHFFVYFRLLLHSMLKTQLAHNSCASSNFFFLLCLWPSLVISENAFDTQYSSVLPCAMQRSCCFFFIHFLNGQPQKCLQCQEYFLGRFRSLLRNTADGTPYFVRMAKKLVLTAPLQLFGSDNHMPRHANGTKAYLFGCQVPHRLFASGSCDEQRIFVVVLAQRPLSVREMNSATFAG